ncbi:MAG: replication restart helicase PriA [Gemmatimonadota bacterium]
MTDQMTEEGRPVENTGGRVALVSLPRPVLQSFHYLIPAALEESAVPGVRVVVPFGRRRETGILEARVEPPADGARKLKELQAVLDEEPVLSPRLIQLCRWVADYYAAPAGFVYRAALPPGMLGGGKEGGELRRQVIRIVRELPTLVERERVFGRARRQREAYETLESIGGRAEVAHMERQLGFGRSVLAGLVQRELAEIVSEAIERDPFAGSHAGPTVPGLNPDQESVLAELVSLAEEPAPGVAVLRGVTGSGKTVVYLRLMRSVVDRGRSAILLVPEISLTPQTVERVRAEFGNDVAVLHSGLSDGERRDAWQSLRAGRKRVVVGTRSAVFAPVEDLGVIVVDEEHDGSYKQGDTPRYHARSVAVVRSRMEGALCVVGSATPSLESWELARSGKWASLVLPDRATQHPLPEVQVVDMRREEQHPPPRILSESLREALSETLARGEQSILLLNRRGHSTWVSCGDCGWVAACGSCNVSLTWHRRRGRLVCHHCGFEQPSRDSCPECGGGTLAYSGLGTEQVERYLGEQFPEARIARMDVDTTGDKWAHRDILESVRRGEIDILLGTQMISKGLDLPGVTLVGVIDADVGLNLPDFRASERTFQLLAQVAGRAGRGTLPGKVFVQTAKPGHFAIQTALQHDFEAFAHREFDDRAAPAYPPHVRLANLLITGPDEREVSEAAEELSEWLENLIERERIAGMTLLGPAPCPIDRLRNRWRWHLLLKSDDPVTLGSVLRFTASNAPVSSGLRLEIDRDPESLL